MNKLTLTLLAGLLAGAMNTALAGPVVLAAHPLTQALTATLTADTGIEARRVAPASIPPTRLLSYFSGRGAPALQQAATGADAVVALRSIWPEDPLYPLARRCNIRIVEIDAARPVDGALPGIALQGGPQAAALGAYPWLDAINLGRMADIVAADLGRLSPDDRAKIESNLAAFRRQLVTLAAGTEAQLAAVSNVSVLSLSDRLDYLISGFNLDLVGTELKEEEAWTTQALGALSQRLKSQSVALVVHHQQPSEELARAIAAGGARLVVLDTTGADPLGELERNATRLTRALGARR